MKRILFATDFSPLSENAFSYALELYSHEACIYTIFHVIPFTYHHDEVFNNGAMSDIESAESSMSALLSKFASYTSKKEVYIETKIEYGDPANMILRYADKMKMDLILAGTKGEGLGSFYLGSTVYHIMKGANCPMLAIPEKTKFKKPKKILFAIDLKKRMKGKALFPLISIAKKFQAEILLLQVKGEEETVNEAALGLKINSSLEGLSQSFHVIYENNIAEGIARFAIDNDADLLFMISKQRPYIEQLFHRSVRKKVILYSKLPIMLLDNN